MFRRNLVSVWIGVILLSGMFLMGQESWVPPNERAVFVTESVHTGDFGGLEGADAICQSEADAAGLAGTFLAWLSDSTESPSTRFKHYNAILEPLYPYKLVDGTSIASGWTDLTDGTVDNMIYVTATGTPPNGLLLAWTNTKPSGQPLNVLLDPALDSCSDWTDSWMSGWGGQPKEKDANWTLAGPVNCHAAAHLYCFQQ